MPEVNFDGLVGPTHSYAGLSYGNVASARNQGAASSPRSAALQGLAKMEAVAALGLVQGVLPPHERPHLPTLRGLGFTGSDAEVLAKVSREDPVLLARVSSASAMWTANAATVMPSADTRDGRTHFVAANLREMFHRAIEPTVTARALRAIFGDRARFEVHEALPARTDDDFGDEGAANHTRLTGSAQAGGEVPGIHLFAYGAHADGSGRRPSRHPARQTFEASRAIAQAHGIPAERCLFAQQHPAAIDKGVFHNDVISVGNGNLLLVHEMAFLDQDRVLDDLARMVGPALRVVVVPERTVSADDAVRTYLFNSQLVTLPDGTMALVLPGECAGHPGVQRVVADLVADPASPVKSAIHLDLRESMRNGGGPACLRLRVPLTQAEAAAVAPGCLWTPALHARLEDWVHRRYRETLAPEALGDPALLRESREALDELTAILGIGPVYPFQR